MARAKAELHYLKKLVRDECPNYMGARVYNGVKECCVGALNPTVGISQPTVFRDHRPCLIMRRKWCPYMAETLLRLKPELGSEHAALPKEIKK